VTEVVLVPIAESDFAVFMESTLPAYSSARAKADHVSRTTAEEAARRQQLEILPAGFSTPGHFFFRICIREGTPVGRLWLWLDTAESAAYVYDIEVDEPHRRRGYASAALDVAEDLASKAGCRRIGLNVFEPNSSAQALYRKLGYSVGSLYMSKAL
jgi:ribosomal protein S18 acetylase RimI-like enzyme